MNQTLFKRIIDMTMGHLERTHNEFEDSHDRFLKAQSFIQNLELHLSDITLQRYVYLAVAEYESRFSDYFIDLQQSTDVMLAITHRITGETTFHSIRNIAL